MFRKSCLGLRILECGASGLLGTRGWLDLGSRYEDSIV